ncbi:MAG: DUF6485 family protein [candidate division WOR-3 bacterium]
MECNIKRNLSICNCSYPTCEKKGKCCECLHYHLKRKEVPACFFSKELERTYDRSIENFMKHYKG